MFVSLKLPVISPAALMLWGVVSDELGGSKTVMMPLLSRTNPRNVIVFVSKNHPVISPAALMLSGCDFANYLA